MLCPQEQPRAGAAAVDRGLRGGRRAGRAAALDEERVVAKLWWSCCPWVSFYTVDPGARSHFGVMLEELQPVGSPRGVGSEKMAAMRGTVCGAVSERDHGALGTVLFPLKRNKPPPGEICLFYVFI